jgi:hypothetical protein
VVGQHLGLDPVDAEATSDGVGGDPVVAGEHHDLDPVPAQRFEGGGRGLLDGVGDGEDPGEPVVDADEDRGRAVGAEPVGLRAEAAGGESLACEERRAAQQDAVALDPPGDALAAGASKSVTSGIGSPASGRGVDDGAAERVLGGAFDARGEPQQLVAVEPGAGTIAVTDGRPSVRVPVLSTTSVSTFSISSSASAFLISTPRPAPRPTRP